MRIFFRAVKNIINRLLVPFGIEVNRKITYIPDTSLYFENTRPAIPRYVNVGAGKFYHPYWHNLDHPNDYYSESQKKHLHIEYDLRSHSPLPFSDNSLKVVYTSHVIEHVDDSDVSFLFSEVYRCLQPGGYFRITCPDIDLEYDAFCRGDSAFWRWPNAYGVYNTCISQKFLDHFATALTETHPFQRNKKYSLSEIKAVFGRLPKEEALDFLIQQLPTDIQRAFPCDHINWFNYEKINKMLKKENFMSIYESRYLQSRCAILRDSMLFDYTCPELSLYIECCK